MSYPTMRMAFHNAWRGNDPLDWSVDVFSGFGGKSHSELVFRDGTCLSSTIRDPWEGFDRTDGQCFIRKSGLRFKVINFNKHPARWSFAELPYDEDQERDIRAWCEWLCADRRAEYDYWGVSRFVFPWLKEHPEDWFCTESNVQGVRLPENPEQLAEWKCDLTLPLASSINRSTALLGFKPDVPAFKFSPNKAAKILGVN